MEREREYCANCGREYLDHQMPSTKCTKDGLGRWFPSHLALAMLKQEHDRESDHTARAILDAKMEKIIHGRR